MALKQSFIALVLALPALAQQQPVWSQCGGIGWTGATQCVAGTTCTTLNDYFSQCLPTPVTGPTTVPTTILPPSTAPSTTTSGTTSPTSTAAPGSCPSLPANPTLTSNTFLPDPFTFFGGTKVTTKAQWDCRRQELSTLLQKYELGTLPPKPASVTGTLSGTTLTVNVSDSGKSISFTASISYPSTAAGPFPAFIAVGGMSIPRPSNVVVITFNNDDMAAQVDSSSRGQGKFYQLYGTGHSAGAMTAWAWGISRVVDVLETIPSSTSRIDLTKLAVTGCSRNGKGALVAGAFEPRITLTIPQESGSGGAGCWRISDKMLASGISTQTASEIVQENVWFSTNFNPFVNQVNNLPFDHHLLAALVAPRALLMIDNTGIDWLGPESVWGCMSTANDVWKALGVADSMGVSQVGNHNHCAFPSSEQGDLDAFVNKFLNGQSTNTNIIKTDGANGLGFVRSQWVNYSVPTLT
ncbi:carbohydrate esterase family 15 protein [Macrolepiota fuliginosa MF-IS2]|uniref:(4-O-methyl)-D-glucuronate--lignin esterase n=1 Tax=Macrolepiota fuliginosa MF-IS2 TaxID=1400762 RepID=A0A9P5XE11_9AGAR|nr:carbohydrate esterase family 15 protein [Macrolepiota fuliginosa MF-IS2]